MYSCGLSEHLDRFQFVGNIESVTDQTRELLQTVSLWETHGKHYIRDASYTGPYSRAVCQLRANTNTSLQNIGFQQKNDMDASATGDTAWGHSKGSSWKMSQYYTSEMLKLVREELYADDYKIWKLLRDNEGKMSSGKILASQLSENCAIDSYGENAASL